MCNEGFLLNRQNLSMEHQQKTFIKLSRFWLLRGWNGFSKSIALKKENL